MNPILVDIPMPIFTPRLLLRPPQPGDGAEVNAAIHETLEDLQRWMPWATKPPTIEESEEGVRRAFARWMLREDLRILIYDRASGRLAGSSGLHRIDWDIPRFEIGFWARKSFEGRGYVTEATNALTRYAFGQLRAQRIEIRCDSANVRSQAVIKRLGFEYEGL